MDTQELTRVDESHVDEPMLERLRLATAQRMLRDLPRSIGRYRVVGKIGEGGMGTVFRAHDPELDRPVAIKLLKPQGFVEQNVAEQARMFREARALAAVPHPNVVEIYEVGQHAGSVFLAMEYVDAIEIREWIDYDDPEWVDVVRAFVDAGRGLAAAHERGLVHRDFKPSNVLLGRDGRVRVVDFGLAKGLYDLTPTPSDPSGLRSDATGSGTSQEALAIDLTRTGALIGTPAYMAPEQLRGTRADAAADQFAFCVSLWEGLYGHRPFVGKTPKTVLRTIERGVPRSPRSPRVPAVITRAIRRGLAANPAERWPSLSDLLGQLEIGTRRSQRLPLLAAWATAVAAVGIAAWPAPDDEGCGPRGDALASWSALDRDRTRDAYEAAAMTVSWSRIEAGMDAYAADLGAAWAELCATPRRFDLVNDAQLSCLRERTVAANAVAELVATSEPPMSSRLLASLSPVSSCLEAELDALGPPGADADAVQAVQQQFTRANVLQLAGKSDAALQVMTEAMARARGLGWETLEARGRIQRAGILVAEGRHDDAVRDLELAFDAARRGGDDATASVAAGKLAHVLGVEMNRTDEGLSWARHSETAARRAGKTNPSEHLHATLGLLHVYAGNTEEALAELEAAATTLGEATNRLSPRDRVDTHRQLGGVLLHLGRPKQAQRHFEAALILAEDHYGDDAHDVAALSFNLGLALAAQGDDPSLTLRSFSRAVAVYSNHLPSDHPDFGDALFHRGLTTALQGRVSEGKDDMQRGIEILSKSLGTDDRFVVQARLEFAELLLRAGEIEDARTVALPAHSGAQAALGVEHPLYGRAARLLGDLAARVDDEDEARTYYAASLAAVDGREPRTRDLRLETLLSLAELEHRTGHIDQATQHADEAERLALVLHGEPDPRTSEVMLRLLPVRRTRGLSEPIARRAASALQVLVERAIDPQLSTAFGLEVALALESVGDHDGALVVAQRGREQAPADTEAAVVDDYDALLQRLDPGRRP